MLVINIRWQGETIQKYWELWWNRTHPVKLRNLPPLVCSGIWLDRNNKKNKDKENNWIITCSHIVATYNLIPKDEHNQQNQNINT